VTNQTFCFERFNRKLAKKKATEIASGSPLLVLQQENRISRNHSQGSFES